MTLDYSAAYSVDKTYQVKQLMETAKLFDITVNDDLFNRILEKVYEKDEKILVDETTTRTKTETK